jgi:hypothetical protein
MREGKGADCFPSPNFKRPLTKRISLRRVAADGKWLPGGSPNAGGLTRQQQRTMPKHAHDNQSRTYQEIRYLTGIAVLAR